MSYIVSAAVINMQCLCTNGYMANGAYDLSV